MENKCLGYPNFVLNSLEWRDALNNIFNYNAPFYDLEKYDEAVPGSGIKIWNQILKEVKHQKMLKERRARVHGNVTGKER